MKKKTRAKSNSKAKLAWGIVLTILFVASLVTSILFMTKIDGPNGNTFGTFGGILLWVAIGTCIGGYLLLLEYENDKGKKGALCMIFFIIVWIPVTIVMLLFGICKKIYQRLLKIPPQPKEEKFKDIKKDDYENYKVTIKINGYERDLHWDKCTETWRDSSGAQYISEDGENFIKVRD